MKKSTVDPREPQERKEAELETGYQPWETALGVDFEEKVLVQNPEPKLAKAGGDKLLKQALSAAGPWGRVAKAVLDKDRKSASCS